MHIILFGRKATCEKAKNLLENQIGVQQIQILESGVLSVLFSESFEEKSLIPLLAGSGVSGFRLINQASSRKGAPPSL